MGSSHVDRDQSHVGGGGVFKGMSCPCASQIWPTVSNISIIATNVVDLTPTIDKRMIYSTAFRITIRTIISTMGLCIL
jgi:hypothetical protein